MYLTILNKNNVVIRLRGFTLIELLLGFLIFALIAMALHGVFVSGLKIQQRAQNEGDIFYQTKLNLDLISRELESAIKINLSQVDPSLRSFEVRDQGFSFLLIDRDIIKRVSYYVQEPEKIFTNKVLLGERSDHNIAVSNRMRIEQESVVLMRREELLADIVHGRRHTTDAAELVLDGIEKDSFRIEYAYLDTKTDIPSLFWRGTWTRDELPAGMRFSVTVLPKDPRARPVTLAKDIYIPTGIWEEEM